MMMPEPQPSKPKVSKTTGLTGAEHQRGSKAARTFDTEIENTLARLQFASSESAAAQPNQPLQVQPPQPELVSRLVNFIKKI
jgi:hypothetical protein